MNGEAPALPDFGLVAGFRYRCLPGCGLCCYTTPAVAPGERARLIQLDPGIPLLDTVDGWAQIASRAEGGACHFLQGERCRCHDARPATCGEFPLTVHVGQRVQVAVVLTCPGVDLSALGRRGEGTPVGPLSSDFSSEVESVRSEVSHAETTGQLRWALQRRRNVERRLRRVGSWQSEEEVRARLRPKLDGAIPTELRPLVLLEEDEELESLPMFYEPTLGRVAWRPHPGGTEFLSLREAGGIARHLEVLASPSRSPGLDAPARAMLRGYLAYVLERDATISAAYHSLLGQEPALPEQVVASDLQMVADQVVRLAVLRRALTSGQRGELSSQDVENGIRATDMDILDRPTAGLRL
ncbi:MAG: YkgJ family cysteine cluster protein [Thermoplasmata archaeon]